MKISVTQGQVHVFAVTLVTKHEDVHVYMADLRAKYAIVEGYGGCLDDGESTVEVVLGADGDTLHAEKTDAPTIIEFETGSEDWNCHAKIGRYIVYITLFRNRADRELVWADDFEDPQLEKTGEDE